MKQVTTLPLKKLIWEYKLDEADFQAILAGKKHMGWFDQNWALLRLVENLHYYELLKVVDINLLAKHWQDIKKKIFDRRLKSEYDWFLQKYFIPTTR